MNVKYDNETSGGWWNARENAVERRRNGKTSRINFTGKTFGLRQEMRRRGLILMRIANGVHKFLTFNNTELGIKWFSIQWRVAPCRRKIFRLLKLGRCASVASVSPKCSFIGTYIGSSYYVVCAVFHRVIAEHVHFQKCARQQTPRWLRYG